MAKATAKYAIKTTVKEVTEEVIETLTLTLNLEEAEVLVVLLGASGWTSLTNAVYTALTKEGVPHAWEDANRFYAESYESSFVGRRVLRKDEA